MFTITNAANGGLPTKFKILAIDESKTNAAIKAEHAMMRFFLFL
jgi:hypothetical protein